MTRCCREAPTDGRGRARTGERAMATLRSENGVLGAKANILMKMLVAKTTCSHLQYERTKTDKRVFVCSQTLEGLK